jgi:hypothetical protein
MTLTLEIYYRYLPMYESQDMLGTGKALVEALEQETDPAKRISLLRRLVSMKDPKVGEVLDNLLKDENAAVRFTAAKYLAERGDPKAIPFLVRGLSHEDAFYRFNAIRALEEIDHPDTIEPLIGALSDPLDANARRAASALALKTGVKYGFAEAASAEEKRKIIESWREWWKNNRRAIESQPDVFGEVIASREGGARVLVRFDADAPVRNGMPLRVYRSGIVVGHVRVTDAMDRGMVEAVVDSWTLKDSPIRKGDHVGTKEPPAKP